MTTDSTERLGFARATLESLFPGTVVEAGRTKTSPADRRFAILPSAGHPRLLVPASPHRAASVATRSYGGRLTRSARWGYGLAAAGIGVTGTGLLRHQLVAHRGDSDPAMDDHLSAVLGSPVTIAVQLSRARANRKAVLQAIGAGEHPVGFVKAAPASSLPGRLIEREGHSLLAVNRRRRSSVVAPRVEHIGDFGDLRVLVLQPLPTWLPGAIPTWNELVGAVADIAGIVAAPETSLAATPMWARLREDLASLPGGGVPDQLAGYAERVEQLVGDVTVRCGSAHGDFSPWNLWRTRDQLLVWDWERFDIGTPVGHDLLHYRLQQHLVQDRVDPREAPERLLTEAAEVLRDLAPGAAGQATTLAYLMSMAVRYLRDGQTAAGGRLGDVGRWLLPAIGRALDGTRPGHPIP